MIPVVYFVKIKMCVFAAGAESNVIKLPFVLYAVVVESKYDLILFSNEVTPVTTNAIALSSADCSRVNVVDVPSPVNLSLRVANANSWLLVVSTSYKEASLKSK